MHNPQDRGDDSQGFKRNRETDNNGSNNNGRAGANDGSTDRSTDRSTYNNPCNIRGG